MAIIPFPVVGNWRITTVFNDTVDDPNYDHATITINPDGTFLVLEDGTPITGRWVQIAGMLMFKVLNIDSEPDTSINLVYCGNWSGTTINGIVSNCSGFDYWNGVFTMHLIL